MDASLFERTCFLISEDFSHFAGVLRVDKFFWAAVPIGDEVLRIRVFSVCPSVHLCI